MGFSIVIPMAADSGPLSLRDLVYRYSGFLAHPLRWTERHLDLIGSRFEEISTPLPMEHQLGVNTKIMKVKGLSHDVMQKLSRETCFLP